MKTLTLYALVLVLAACGKETPTTKVLQIPGGVFALFDGHGETLEFRSQAYRYTPPGGPVESSSGVQTADALLFTRPGNFTYVCSYTYGGYILDIGSCSKDPGAPAPTFVENLRWIRQ